MGICLIDLFKYYTEEGNKDLNNKNGMIQIVTPN